MITSPRALTALVSTLLCASPALAQEGDAAPEAPASVSPQPTRRFLQQENAPGRGLQISVVGTLGGYGEFTAGFGVGGAYPVLPQGFVPNLNDAFYVDVMLATEFVFYRLGPTGSLFRPVGGVRWEVAFTPELSAYVGGRIGPVISVDRYPSGFYGGPMVGGHWRFSDLMGLRAEFSGGSSAGAAVSTGLTFFL